MSIKKSKKSLINLNRNFLCPQNQVNNFNRAFSKIN